SSETITLTLSSSDISALSGTDYPVGTYSVTFAPGDTSETVIISTTADTAVEADETFTLAVSSVDAGTVGASTDTGTGTIENDDTATLSISDVQQVEGDAGTSDFVFTVTLDTAVDGGLAVAYTSNDDTATLADSDYTDNDGSLSFTGTAGETQTITVQVTGDTAVEADELFSVVLGAITLNNSALDSAAVAVSTGTGIGTISNDDSGPVAVANSASTALNTPVSIPVLVNDVDVDGDVLSLTAASFTTANGGQVEILADGTVSYTPDGLFTGTDSFSYEVCDAALNCATATVTVAVSDPLAGNLPPTAVADSAATVVDTPVTIISLINDADPDVGDVLSVSAVDATSAQGGTVVDNGDGTFSYTPAAGFTGVDTFSYTLSDGNGGTDTAIVSVIVSASADSLPTAVGDGATVLQDSVLGVDIDVLANDSHPSDVLGVVDVTGAANGSVTLQDPDGTPGTGDEYVSYVPAVGFSGIDTFSYTIVDANGDVASAAVTVSVTPQVGIEFAAASNGDLEASGGDIPQLLVSGTLLSAETIEVQVTGGSATAGTDYNHTVSVTIPAGVYDGTLATAIPINLTISDDAQVEGDETIAFSLQNPSGVLVLADVGGTVGSQSVNTYTLQDDDVVAVEFAAATNGDVEASGGDIPQLLINGTVSSDQVIEVQVTGGTASAGTDYSHTVAVTLPAGVYDGTLATAVPILLTISDDALVEGDESISFSLALPATGGEELSVGDADGDTSTQSVNTYTLENDDTATLSINDVQQVEGDAGPSDFVFTVTLDNAVDGGLDVAYTSNDGTATLADSDYSDNDGSLSFVGTAGETQTITVPVTGDTVVEADELFSVVLGAITLNNSALDPAAVTVSSVDAGTVGASTDTGTGTIENDDTATLTIDNVTLTEGDAGTTAFVFTVTLDTAVDGGLAVAYTSNDGTATLADSDYTDNDGSLSFTGTAGETQTITVQVTGDTVVEADELFSVVLGAITLNNS
ncbi:MAG: tandem-95 repeat protein, partial [Candidatus Competibacteraceae bacterium]|nr:tandem-95 repeat protein [Candidatus Competibacteraceae bacterium]